MKFLPFFLRQARSSLKHDRQRTLFVLFCIAVGVAAVVALRTVGLMIGEGLTRDLQADNRGDIAISVPMIDERISDRDYDESLVEAGGEFTSTSFSAEGLDRIATWASARGIEMQRSVRHLKPATVYALREGDEASATALVFLVEAEGYPFYGSLSFVAPSASSLADVLSEPNRIAISSRLAKTLEVGLGDRLQIQGPEPFIVGAILDDSAEARMREMEAVILPTLLIPYESGSRVFGVRADTVYLKVPTDQELGEVSKSFQDDFVGTRVLTTQDLRERNSEISSMITRLITTLGLISLLIGGIGIANTMSVNVGRRTLEIGVLKTIGLPGRQITFMFLVEALIEGVLGSLIGVAIGLGMVAALQGLAESVFAQVLEFQIYPEAIVMGLVTGVLVTLVFGFLPTLAAGGVRPNVVLQPNLAIPPRTRAGLSLLVVAALTAVVGVMVGWILERMGQGIALAYGAVVILGLMTWAFRGVVALVGRLPSLGSTYIKLTQRAIRDRPGRTASTLLALVVGMFALSSILLMTGSLVNLIDDVMEEKLGGDVIVIPDTPEASARAEVLIGDLEGLKAVKHQLIWSAQVVAVNGDRDLAKLEKNAYRVGKANSEDSEDMAIEDDKETKKEGEFDEVRFLLKDFLTQHSISLYEADDRDYEIGEGRDLEPGLEGKIVLRANDATEWFGLTAGSELTLAFGGDREVVVEVVGLIAAPDDDNFNVSIGEETRSIASAGVVPEGEIARPTPFIVYLEEEQQGAALRSLSEHEGIFALPVALVNQILTGLFEKLTALPLVVALLALFTSGVIIANTVSLSVLERRRQIGVMKAIGLHSRQVLWLLMLESGLVGLLGGLIGTGLGAMTILAMGVLTENPESFPFWTLLALVGLAIAIALLATLITAWGASREKPLIVLRYE